MRPVHLPRTVEEALDILAAEPGARVYAGGTDLLVQVRRGLIQADSLVCLERVRDMGQIGLNGDSIRIGAVSSHSRTQTDPLVSRKLPLLVRAIETLGSPPIRHMGTIGGNIVNASPAGDTLPPLFVLDAEVELRSRDEIRTMPVSDFIVGPGITKIRRDELLTGVIVPVASEFSVHHFEKVGRRKAQACSIASLAASVRLSSFGIIEEIRLAWGSVGPTVVRSREIERALVGRPMTRESLTSVIPMVERAISPIDDIRAGAEYRRMVAGNLLLRLSATVHGDTDKPMVSRCGRFGGGDEPPPPFKPGPEPPQAG